MKCLKSPSNMFLRFSGKAVRRDGRADLADAAAKANWTNLAASPPETCQDRSGDVFES